MRYASLREVTIMPSPFPGMDPYLEDRQLWPDVHLSLIVAIRDALAPQVEPDYYVRIETGGVAVLTAPVASAVIVWLPQFEPLRERYLEIVDARTHEVITAIELLSPTNKIAGPGRREYEAKRQQVLTTLTNLVEIDLLRIGRPLAMEPGRTSDYCVLIGR